jgi:hypothetical protein
MLALPLSVSPRFLQVLHHIASEGPIHASDCPSPYGGSRESTRMPRVLMEVLDLFFLEERAGYQNLPRSRNILSRHLSVKSSLELCVPVRFSQIPVEVLSHSYHFPPSAVRVRVLQSHISYSAIVETQNYSLKAQMERTVGMESVHEDESSKVSVYSMRPSVDCSRLEVFAQRHRSEEKEWQKGLVLEQLGLRLFENLDCIVHLRRCLSSFCRVSVFGEL